MENDEQTYEVIASALSGDDTQTEPASDGPTLDDTVLDSESERNRGASESPPARLGGMDDIQGRIRRRVDALLCEDEHVECVLQGHRKRGSRYLVATNHRILVVGRSEGAGDLDIDSFPYHRTDPLTTTERELTLECQEFGNARIATIELREGHALQISYVLDRLASA